MFLWTWRQVVWFFVMLAIMVLVLNHPAWRKPFETIFTAVFIVIAVLSLAYVLRKS